MILIELNQEKMSKICVFCYGTVTDTPFLPMLEHVCSFCDDKILEMKRHGVVMTSYHDGFLVTIDRNTCPDYIKEYFDTHWNAIRQKPKEFLLSEGEIDPALSL